MTNITLSVPDEVYARMKMHREIRWSEIVRRALKEYIDKVDEGGIEMTTNDLLEELGDDFRKALSRLSFEKAVKEYEKIRDAEWKRISMTQAD